MCIFEEYLCRFVGLDCFAMLIAYPIILDVRAIDALLLLRSQYLS